MPNIGIILQARMGSSRLPGKVLMHFYEDKSIIEILIDKLNQLELPIFIATTNKKEDDIIEEFCVKKKVNVYRGNEYNVLSRFIDIASKNKYNHVVRICADNPFICINEIKKMLVCLRDDSEIDYVSYLINGTPSIKTHFGFWGEIISLKAMEKANWMGNAIHFEHVTSFVYENKNLFKIKWLPVSEIVSKNIHIRLTIDTIEDFKNAQYVFNISSKNANDNPEELILIVNNNNILRNSMLKQIENNSK